MQQCAFEDIACYTKLAQQYKLQELNLISSLKGLYSSGHLQELTYSTKFCSAWPNLKDADGNILPPCGLQELTSDPLWEGSEFII